MKKKREKKGGKKTEYFIFSKTFKNQRFPTVFVVQIPQNFPLKVKILKSVVFCPKPLKVGLPGY